MKYLKKLDDLGITYWRSGPDMVSVYADFHNEFIPDENFSSRLSSWKRQRKLKHPFYYKRAA